MNPIKLIYKAHGDAGTDRGIGPVIGYFTSESQASLFARGKGWYGSDGGTSAAYAIQIDGKWYVLESRNPIDLDRNQAEADAILRAETLASLTADQKRVLGIK